MPPDKIVIRRGRRFHKNDWPDLHELLNKPTTLLLYPGPTGWHNYLIIKPFAPKINMSIFCIVCCTLCGKIKPYLCAVFFFSSPFHLLNKLAIDGRRLFLVTDRRERVNYFVVSLSCVGSSGLGLQIKRSKLALSTGSCYCVDGQDTVVLQGPSPLRRINWH